MNLPLGVRELVVRTLVLAAWILVDYRRLHGGVEAQGGVRCTGGIRKWHLLHGR